MMHGVGFAASGLGCFVDPRICALGDDLMAPSKTWFRRPFAWIAVAAIALALFAWQWLRPKALPAGFAGGNGRIEAVEINIAGKISGRIQDVLANEGDLVRAGQVLAQMDTTSLMAQRSEAEAQLQGAIIGIDTTRAQLEQRKAEKQATLAAVAQREAELEAARKRFERSEHLAGRGTTPEAVLDDDRAKFESARAAVSAAKAQVAAADAAIGAAEAQVIDAQARVVAARATVARIQADIDDSSLKSPRDGRVQYRVAQPGEVLSAGGTVLNMVDLGDVYMTFFLPTAQAGRLAIGAEARLVLDAAPHITIPATVSYVADVAQFTPKTVETAEERQKLMFRVKAHIAPELLRKHIRHVKTGLPGMAYVRLDPKAEWPANLNATLLK